MNNQASKFISFIVVLGLNFQLGLGQTEFLVSVNAATGAFTKIDCLPGVALITLGPRYTTFDESNQR